jgi:hypothetical protein
MIHFTVPVARSSLFHDHLPYAELKNTHAVIPGLTKPAPDLIRGNPGIFWIPAFAGMTKFIQ